MRHSRPLPPGDKRVLFFLIVHLVFLPWALGTMHAWSQAVSLTLAVAGFVVALTAGNGKRQVASEGISDAAGDGFKPLLPTASPFPQSGPLGRLLRFPPFWLGLVLLAYIAVQALNPSWRYTTNGTFWWLVRMPNISWLPTSIATPFERFNAWRQLIIYASAWLTLCTVAIGLTRRRSFGIVLTVLAINTLVLIVAGLSARIGNPTSRLLWFEERSQSVVTFASFIYKNHAGAYLALMAAVLLTLGARYRERALREHAPSSPALLAVLGAIITLFAVVFTYSRGATALLGAYLLAAAVIFFVHRILTGAESTTPRIVTFTVTGMIAVVVIFALAQVDFGKAVARFQRLADPAQQDISLNQRIEANEAGRDMLSHTWPRGVGAGSFRHLFPEYIRRFEGSYKGGRLFWEHAHNDWLEISIELGLAGSAIALAGGIWWGWRIARRSLWRSLPVLLLIFGLGQTLAHAAIDFPFQNPAILITWLVLAVMVVRYGERQPEN